MKFDLSLNLGHVIAVVAILGSAAAIWNSAYAEVAAVDSRTADYPHTRDVVIGDTIRIDALAATLSANTATNQAIMSTLADVRADLAAIKARLP